MAFLRLSLLFVLPVVLIIYKAFSWARITRHNSLAARRFGCLPAPKARNHGLLGIRTLVASVRATKQEWGPVFMHQAINEVKLTADGTAEKSAPAHTIRAQILDYELLITRDTENVKAMLATQSDDFDIGTHRERTFRSLLGPGVMTTRSQRWKHSRALVRGQFARWNVADLGLLKTHVDALMTHLRGTASGAGEWTSPSNIMPLFYAFTLDTSTEFLFGSSTSMLNPTMRPAAMTAPGGPDFEGFGAHLDGAKALLDRRGALAKYGWLLRDHEYPMHCAAVQRFVDYFVQQRLGGSHTEKPRAKTIDNREKFVLLDQLAKETSDPVELRCELLNVLHASRDTTAALLSWTVYFLARHPAVWDLLRRDVLNAVGSGPPVSADHDAGITHDKIMAVPYLHWVLNETVRMVGIVPMNERMAMCDTSLPRGGGPDGRSPVFVAEGQQVLIPTYSMQHREDIWGEDVETYRPERWEGRKFGWEFVPFGGGARQCLGRKLFLFHVRSSDLVRVLTCGWQNNLQDWKRATCS